MDAQNALLVFVKYPRAGEVKTRLAAKVGTERAAEMYRCWITDVLTALQRLRPHTCLIGYFTGAPATLFAPWNPLVDEWLPQPEGGLGDRLDHGFRVLSERFVKMAAIGTDCLELDAELVLQSFVMLEHADVVLGPSSDGGYYLISSRGYRQGLFDNIRWSTDRTLQDQIQVCVDRNWRVSQLPARSDIDTWDDWQEYCRRQGRPLHPPSPKQPD